MLAVLFVMPVMKAQEEMSDIKPDTSDYSWERFSLIMGGFVTGLNSDLLIGSRQLGLGVCLNLEDALGLETSSLVLRGELEYNFGKRARQAVRFGYFGFFRNARKIVESDLEIGDVIFPVGTEVTSEFDLQIFKGTYYYSFYMDDRVKLGFNLGLFVMPIRFSTSALHLSEVATHFVAPLPVLGLHTNFAIAPKLFLKQSIEILYLEISDFKGSISDVNFKLEYNTWRHFGLGVGVNSYRLNITGSETSSSLLDFEGVIKTSYTGLMFYGKFYF